MRIKKPKMDLAPEVYAAIVQDHGSDALRLGQSLQSLGWTLADAAWAAVNWSLEWMAAAVAVEKQKRNMKLHTFSEAALTALRAELATKPRRTPRISHKPNKPKEK